MSYAVIAIDNNTRRVLRARLYSTPQSGEIGVEELPTGNINDYLYENGRYIYCPDEVTTKEMLQQKKEEKLSEVSAMCQQTIYKGIDIDLSDGNYHFSLTENDQTNIDGIFNAIILGASEYPYHADGEPCAMFSAEDITKLYVSVKTFVTQETTYNNMLRQWIKREADINTLNVITYGSELPEDLKTQMNNILVSASAQVQSIISKLQS